MHRLLVSLPFLAALALYYGNYRRDFVPLKTEAPDNWVWPVLQPVLLSVFAPLLALSQPDLSSSQKAALALVLGLSVLAVIILMATLGRSEYSSAQSRYGTVTWALPWLTPAKVVLAVGSACIILSAGATLWATAG